MFIVPISDHITPIKSITPTTPEVESSNENEVGEASFLDVFKSLYSNAKEANVQKNADAVSVMLGEIDDLHTVQANITKAVLAMETLVSVRNKAVDAYKEIMSMNV